MSIQMLKTQQASHVLNSEEVYNIMQKMLLRENKIEHYTGNYWIIGLAGDNTVLFIEWVSLGELSAATVEPMNIFRVAILKQAAQTILVHNDPSDHLVPSEEDKDLTDRLMQVGRLIGVPIIDHLIISSKGFYSFVDQGLHAELQQSLKWMPPYEIVAKIRAEEQKIKQDELRLAKLEMARELKQRGVAPNIIAETSGLSTSDIDKL